MTLILNTTYTYQLLLKNVHKNNSNSLITNLNNLVFNLNYIKNVNFACELSVGRGSTLVVG